MASSDMEDLTLTKEESERLKKAFKDEKFVRLLQEYADEVNDPENRKKYEDDVIAVEKKYGSQVTFIHQEAGYVIKTSEEGEKKAFINVCQNDKVDKPSFTKDINSGREGTRWELPHLLTPPREDLDKSHQSCIVYDVIFHPDTLLFARNNEDFRKMIDNVALDAVESKFDIKLDRTNVRFLKMKYKGCPTAPITRKKVDIPSPKDSEDEEFDDQFKELFKPPMKSFNWNESKKKKCEKQEEVEASSATRPKYSIKYRNHIDIQDYTNAPHQTVNIRPHEIIVDIQLPLLNSASDLNLDIYEKRLLLVSNKKGASYKLDLALPYSVNENDGKAQFDKAKRKLCITLKVLPSVSNLETNLSNKIKNDLEECPSDKLENDLDINQPDKIQDHLNEDLELKEQMDNETNKDSLFYNLTVNNMNDDVEFEKVSIDLIENKNLLEENSPLTVATDIQEIAEMNDITERLEENLHVDEKEETISEKSQADKSIQEKNHDCDLNMPLFQTIPYSVPKFDYYQTPKIVTLVVQVKNIDSSSIYTYFCDCHHSCRVTFYTLGEGFVPFYYCLFLKFEHLLATNTETMRVSLSKDNLVLHLIKDANYCCCWTEFQAGLNDKQLTKYEFVCKTAMLKTIQELKDESENVMAGDKLTNENVHVEDVSLDQVTFDINLKQTIRDQIEKEIDSSQDSLSDQSKQDILTIMTSSTKLRTSSGSSEDQNQSPLQKKRGILKYPRYYCRTISESSDDTFWSSLDNDCTPVGSLDNLGEKPKKCVRFSDQIAKTVFRANSSILGQRKKNQRKARNRKKTTNKTSESDNCTETSEENSDYNSTNEAESGPIDVNKCGTKLYAWQENKNSENLSSEVEKIQLSKSEFDKKEQLSFSVNDNNSIDSQCENDDKMTNLTKSSQHFTFGLKENQKITIMQRPSTAASMQKPTERSSLGLSNFAKSHCICKPGEKKNEKGSQKGDNANGETKQKSKWRKRRRWRNKKNNSNHLPGTLVGNQLLEQNVLKRNNNRIGEEEGCNWIYDNNPKYYNNNQEVVVNKTFENCSIPNAFWMCNQSAEYDPRYRTKCMVNFANQVMFQLD